MHKIIMLKGREKTKEIEKLEEIDTLATLVTAVSVMLQIAHIILFGVASVMGYAKEVEMFVFGGSISTVIIWFAVMCFGFYELEKIKKNLG
jgi:arginine exporter protein ArgO